MKYPLAPARIAEKMAERERRYPIYTFIDLTIYWGLCLALFGICAFLCAVVLYNNSPQFAQWVEPILHNIRQ